MPHAFALQGPGKCGKSATFLQIYNKLKHKYPTTTIKSIHNSTDDISVILTGVNGYTVGIESRDTPGSRLQRTLNAFAAAKCDIIFCPCRTKGMTVQWVKTLPLQYKIHFIQQNRVATKHAAANAATAALLMQQAGI